MNSFFFFFFFFFAIILRLLRFDLMYALKSGTNGGCRPKRAPTCLALHLLKEAGPPPVNAQSSPVPSVRVQTVWLDMLGGAVSISQFRKRSRAATILHVEDQ